MNIRKIIISLVAIAIVILIGFSIMKMLSGMKKDPESKKQTVTKLYVHADSVNYSVHAIRIQANGRIVAGNKVSLGAQMQGELLKGEVELLAGTSFKKGQLLARIYNENAIYSIKAQKSRFINSMATVLPDLKIDFPQRHAAFLKFFNSLSLEGTIAEFPESLSNKETVFLAGRNILNDYYSIKSQEVQMQKYNLYAPFDGAFTQVNMEIGSMVNPGSMIATMIHTTSLEVVVPISTEDIYLIKVGEKADLLATSKNIRIQGTVNRIADYIDETSQSINVFIELPNQNDPPLFQGQYFNVEFNSKKIDSCMLIPRNALVNNNMVYIVRDSILQTNEIEVLHMMDKDVMIRGVEEGVQIVNEPLVNAKVGTKTIVLD